MSFSGNHWSSRDIFADEMDIKNGSKMSLAVGNNFLRRHGTNDSTLVTYRLPNRYLAINWQRADMEPRVPNKDRRFPTPPQRSKYQRNTRILRPENSRARNGTAVTTNHLLLPSQQRKPAFSPPIARPNCDFLWGNCNEREPRGAGGVSRRFCRKVPYR